MGPEGFVLWGRAMGLTLGGLTHKERRGGGFRRAGDVERDGGIKIRTPTLNDSDDKHALLGVDRQPSGVMTPARIMAVGWFTRLPLSMLPKTNIARSHSTHAPHTPQNCAFTII